VGSNIREAPVKIFNISSMSTFNKCQERSTVPDLHNYITDNPEASHMKAGSLTDRMIIRLVAT
jgi:hypothetical protein